MTRRFLVNIIGVRIRQIVMTAAFSVAMMGAVSPAGLCAISGQPAGTAKSPNELMAAAQAALRQQNYTGALNDLNPLVSSHPGYAPAWFDLAYAYTGLKENEQAVSAYRKCLKLQPDLFQARLNLGILLLMMKRPADALPQLKEAVALQPDDAHAHRVAARAYELTGDAAAAGKELQIVTSLPGNSGEAFLDLGQLEFNQKDYAAASQAFEKAAAQDPQLTQAKLGAGLALMNLRQNAAAVPYFKQVLAANSDDAKARYELALAQTNLGQYPKALASLQMIERKDPSFPGLNAALGAIYAELQQFPESEKYYRLAIASTPEQASFHRALGGVLMREKNYSGAEAEYRATLRMDPSNREAASGLAASECDQQRYADAIPLLLELIQTPPATAGNYLMLAMSYDHLHDLRRAIEAYKEFLSLSRGKHPNREWQARQRIKLFDHELGR